MQAWDRAETTQLATGTLQTVDNQIDTTTGTIRLRAVFDNADDKLFPNQFVNIVLSLSTLRDATVVPSATIQRASFGTFVYAITDDSKATVRRVTLGPAEGERVAVTEGLSPGDRVVLEGVDALREGIAVEVVGTRQRTVMRPWRRVSRGGSVAQPPGQANRRQGGDAAMNISRPFILRPVATALLMGALLLSGMLAYRLLPVSALPQVDYPTIRVLTFYPGASPEVMTSAVTAPLERQFGQIPGLDQMSSTSSGGASVLTLRFSLDKPIEVAEQEVQAAINAAGNLLPNDLPQPPVYNKVNPADTPVLTLSVTSPTMPLPAVYDLVDTRIAQKLSQLPGVGLVSIAGGQRPAVRIQANPQALAAHNLNLQNLRAVIAAANVNQPKGNFDGPERSFMLDANDQLRSVQAYKDLIIAYQDGAPLRLSDVAQVVDGAENTRLSAWADDAPAVLVNIQRQPGANVIDVVDRIRAVLPQLTASLPETVSVAVLSDRTDTIRASVRDVQHELVFAVALVVMVTFVFLRNIPATIIPSVVVPLSLIGTFGVMYLAGFSINNLTLMALTIATGFVVDDAIVMVENIARYLEEGATPMQAALEGARQIGFTLVSLTVSLIAVLIPLLFMADVVGRLFREFAITLAVSILISLVVSLTLTPMMCARLLKAEHDESHGRLYRATGYFLDKTIELYGKALNVALRYEDGDARHRAGHDGADGLAVRHRAEGLLPGAGHRRHPGDHRGAADGVVLGDGRRCSGTPREPS